MNLVERARNILFTPKTEWTVIAGESATIGSLLTGYVVPLSLIPVLAIIINGIIWSGIGIFNLRYFVILAVGSFVKSILVYIIASYIVDLLAVNFRSEKDINRSAQLVAYASTGYWIASILDVVPVLGWLATIAGASYSVFLMYMGIGPLKKTVEEQRIVYVIVSVVLVLVVMFVMAAIFNALFLASSYGIGTWNLRRP